MGTIWMTSILKTSRIMSKLIADLVGHLVNLSNLLKPSYRQMLYFNNNNNNSRVLLFKRSNQVKLEVNILRMLRPSTPHNVINC